MMLMFCMRILSFLFIGRGGASHRSRMPCTFCAVKNGQLAMEAPYRCADCLEIDRMISAVRNNSGIPCTFADGNETFDLLDFEDHLSRKCLHHEFLSSDVQAKWESTLGNINVRRCVNYCMGI